MKNIFLFFLLFFGFLFISKAQNSKQIDSLVQILGKLPNDTTKIHTLIKISQLYINIKDTIYTKKYAEEALNLSNQLQFVKGKTDALYLLGIYFINKNREAQALPFFQQSLEVAQSINDKNAITRGLYWVSDTQMKMANYVEALKSMFEQIKHLEEDTSKRVLVSRTYNMIGKVYEIQRNFDKTLEFYQKALSLAEKAHNNSMLSFCYNNIGNFYTLTNQYEKALEYQFKALEIRKKTQEYINIAFSYNDIAYVYDQKGDSLEARKYFLMSYNIFAEKNQSFGIVHIGNNLAENYILTKEYKKAIPYAEKAIEIAKLGNLKDGIRNANYILFQCYQALGDHKKALGYHIDFKTYSDSLVDESKAKEMGRLESFLDLSKKEKENVALKLETEEQADKIRQQQLFFGMLALVALLLVVLAWVFYKANKRKKYDNELLLQQKEEINIQKEEIYAIAENLKDLNKELQKKNTNITASINYAKRIQSAILPLEEEMRKCLDDFFVLWKPKDIVSGDFYWCFHQPELQKTVIAAVDCTGHGVPGAFMSMIGSQLLNEIVIKREILASDLILEEMNMGIYRILHQQETDVKDGMDISLCIIDKKEQKLTFSGAMNPLYYVQNNILSEIRGDKHSLGGKQHKDKGFFVSHTINFDTETIIYLSSDGYQDQFGGENNAKFSVKRFKEILFDISSKPLVEQKQFLEQNIEHWLIKNQGKLIDDILVVGVKIKI